MRVVFMGTPQFAATILEELIQHHEVVAVYTRPDAVRGRGKSLVASPVKKLAEQASLPVHAPLSFRDEQEVELLASYEPDVICVAAYGMLLPSSVLEIPRFGCMNVHASLLPRWRGAAPIERAILAGDEEVGVCVMQMEEGLDTGDYCICRTAWVEDKTVEELSDKLANLGSHALLTALVHCEEGHVEWEIQDDNQATYAPKIEKGELNAQLSDTAEVIVRKVRASSPAHPARAILAGKAVTLLRAKPIFEETVLERVSQLQPGDLILNGKRLFMGTQEGVVEVVELKPEGKKAMEAHSFAAGIQGFKNTVLAWDAL